MEVGRRDGDVAQRRHLEHVGILLGARDIEATLVARRHDRPIRLFNHAEGLIAVAAEVDAIMARRAALIHEGAQTVLLGCRHRRVVAAQEAVKGRVGGDQGLFERRDRCFGIRKAHGVRIVRKGGGEQRPIARGYRSTARPHALAVEPISTGLTIGPPACSVRSAARPSQNCAVLNVAFRTVGELRPPFCQR